MEPRQRLVVPYIFLGVFIVYMLSLVVQPSDSRWVLHTSMSIIQQGNTDLDEYSDIVGNYYTIDRLNVHLYNRYPIGTALVAMPFVWLADRVSNGGLAASLHQGLAVGLELIVASFIVALVAIVVYRIALLYVTQVLALLIVVIFAFGTSAWSTSSRALWQHGPSMLTLALALYLLIRARERKSLAALAGVPLAFSYVIRPSNALSIVILTVYVFFEYRRYFIRYLLCAACVALPFVLYNFALYGMPLSPYYLKQDMTLDQLGEALLGHLISPSRGLFIYSPILLLSGWGVAHAIRSRPVDKLGLALFIILLLHWLLISAFRDWPGGTSFGPRYMADVIPYLMYFLIQPLIWLRSKRHLLLWSGVAVLIACSLFINFRGATREQTIFWRGNVWDWQHPQFLE